MDTFTVEGVNRGRRLLVIAGGVIVLAASLLLLFSNRSDQLPKPGTQPDQAVQNVINTYVGAKENRVGADQSSAASWLNQIKPVSTPALLESLKPAGTSQTGGVPYNYTYAHSNNYVVKASISNCKWSGEGLKPTADGESARGVVVCQLTDTTVSMQTGQIVPNSSLQFGWPYIGPQPPPILGLVEQNGKWLVDGDATGRNH